MLRFVVQEHRSRRPHFDFRLEKNGVFKSWAVPKGIPDEPDVKRLAVQVDDHDLAFGDFEGEIPRGDYGAGTISIWDKGSYDPESWSERKIVFTLHGERSAGWFHLIRFTKGRPNDWFFIKLPDSN